MKILVLNCGSSSLKYQLIDMNEEKVLAIGLCERIGIKGSKFKQENIYGEKTSIEKEIKDHKFAVQIVIEALTNKKIGVIDSIDSIDAIGHRVVHGGEKFTKSVIITKQVKDAINECAEIAPLHNPVNLIGINACEELMPNIKQIAVFDTAFHQTMHSKAYLYGIPYELYEKYRIRRYGFHGTSHMYVSRKAAEILNKPIENLKIITCHLGNGGSVCAVKSGKSIDTSMGFTPLQGLMMGTRSGDIDATIVQYIMKKENLGIDEVESILNNKSGLLGVSGVSSDFRDVEKSAHDKNDPHYERANRALGVYFYEIAKYIGAYTASMGGVDAIVFTAGVGENSAVTRTKVCEYLNYLEIKIDEDKNSIRGKEIIITTDESKVKVLVIPTNEELAIARDTKKLLEVKINS